MSRLFQEKGETFAQFRARSAARNIELAAEVEQSDIRTVARRHNISEVRLRQILRVANRDAQIVAEFKDHDVAELAKKYNLSVRRIVEIFERGRTGGQGK